MDKETLSHYGWLIIVLLCMTIIIMLATPFGNYVGVVTQNWSEGLQGKGENIDKESLKEEMNDQFLGDSGGNKVNISGKNNNIIYIADVNGDSNIDETDAEYLLFVSFGLTDQYPISGKIEQYDYDEDGTITDSDAIFLSTYIESSTNPSTEEFNHYIKTGKLYE